MTRRWMTAAAAFGFLFLFAACGGAEEGSAQKAVRMPNGDLLETTAAVDVLPSFLQEQPEEMRLVYQAAAQTADVLKWIPCYCGCGQSAGHRSNLNCFIQDMHEDGSVTWTDHSTRCNVCLETAVISAELNAQGVPLKDIRQHIDQKYSQGYAAPTPTPTPG